MVAMDDPDEHVDPDECPHPAEAVQRRLRGELLCQRCRTVVGHDPGGQLTLPARQDESGQLRVTEAGGGTQDRTGSGVRPPGDGEG